MGYGRQTYIYRFEWPVICYHLGSEKDRERANPSPTWDHPGVCRLHMPVCRVPSVGESRPPHEARKTMGKFSGNRQHAE